MHERDHVSIKRIPTFALLGLLLACGCGKTSNTTSQSNGAGPAPLASPKNGEAAKMTDKDLQGAWRSSVAPEYPLRLTVSGGGYSVDWTPTIDSDIVIAGSLAKKGDSVWHGTVHLRAGEEDSDTPMTLRYDPAKQTLAMELGAMFEAPIVFNRIGKESPGACATAAADVLAATAAFKKLEASAPHLQIMNEDEAADGRTCDLRVVVDGEGGETQTVGRFRVDFGAKQVLEYDPVEDTYTPLAGSSELFKN